ncbi:HTH-type transcriptional regulator DmlR [compost metagenome]
MAFGVARVAAALSAFARSHPGIEVELIITNRPIDLIEEQVDIAIHVGLLRDSGLRSRTLTTFNSVVCASPGYLADRGTPLTPSDIGRHNCITYASGGGAPGDWRFLDANGPIQVEIASSTFKSNSAGAVVVAALDGQGLALVPDYLVREHLESGALVEVLQQYRPAPSLVRALYAPGRFLPAKSRAFIDHLVEYFAVPQ